MNVDNKVVLITGASQGIGAGLAEVFGTKGDGVIVNYCHSKQNALNVVKKINASGGQAVAIKADVSRRKQVELLVKKTLGKFGRVDILINNAGAVFEPAGWREVSDANWDKTIAVDLTGVFNCIRIVAPLMLKQKSGKIINIAALAGLHPRGACLPAYAAAKAGVINLTEAFAKELAPWVRVNAVAPGRINIGMGTIGNSKENKYWARKTILERVGTIDDVINAVLFLASNRSSFITGQTLVIDGGLSLK